MIDSLLNFADTEVVLATTKNAPKPTELAISRPPVRDLSAVLEFASENQQLEGFPGKITEANIAHVPDMKQIAESARRFDAQIPKEENRQRPPLFPRPRG